MGWGHEGAAVQTEAPLLAVGEGLCWGLQDRARQGGCQEGVGGCRDHGPHGKLQPAPLPVLPQRKDFKGAPALETLQGRRWDLRTCSGLPSGPGGACTALAAPPQAGQCPGAGQGSASAQGGEAGGRAGRWQGWHTTVEHIVLHISIADVEQTLGMSPALCPTSGRDEGVPCTLLTCPVHPGHLAEMPSPPQGCTRVSGHPRV